MPAWRLYQFNWLPLKIMGAALAAGLAFSSFSIEWAGVLITLGFVAVYAGMAAYNASAPGRRDPQVVFVLGSTAQIVLITALATPLTYLGAATNLPLQDANLLAIDGALGLDWHSYLQFVNAHPLLSDWLNYGYGMIRWPLFGIPVVLAAARQYCRLQKFTLAFALALIVTAAIAVLVPAFGVYHQLGLDPAAFPHIDPRAHLEAERDLGLVRDGSLRELDLFALAGVVAFPSFHAASALLYSWALWSVRWIRPIALLLNGLMLAATPLNGGHYFIDVLVGLTIATLAIVAARQIGRRIEKRASNGAGCPDLIGEVAPALVPAE